jgi:predicted RNA-binding Zn ribbon-like protein
MDEPEPRAPAPGRLSLVQEFVNSVELPDGEDELGTAEAATQWLRHHNQRLAHKLTDAERRRLVNVREGLRVLLTAHSGEHVDGEVASDLTRQLNAAVLRPVISAAGASLETACQRVDCFLASLTSAMVEATATGTWDRLKVCKDDTCRFAFFDQSKNGRGTWCSMRVCGCRAKARAYRARQRELTPTLA